VYIQRQVTTNFKNLLSKLIVLDPDPTFPRVWDPDQDPFWLSKRSGSDSKYILILYENDLTHFNMVFKSYFPKKIYLKHLKTLSCCRVFNTKSLICNDFLMIIQVQTLCFYYAALYGRNERTPSLLCIF
jgi:hypothetical protein